MEQAVASGTQVATVVFALLFTAAIAVALGLYLGRGARAWYRNGAVADATALARTTCQVAQQMESLGLGLVSPNTGRSATPANVPPMANTAQIQPCRLNEAMPLK